ncbi:MULTISPECIES: type II toxin-antitoxin system RelE/ParE family toxin [Pseudomonas]|uniref:type II toxin-antitoxin system RelE/ParE family toxin n=1 Tax=Pseudomonas TaxID=286 RepID=UPI001E31641F|nr:MULTISPECIES: type II toxin-antitoxin system RelE/ParE family toxin [Pseudomonas]MCE1118738.1 type II toxin-antitoxin system RelE/ParE family toxin [Pseudomonas sp. NMI795_08]
MSRLALRISHQAQGDILDILRYTERTFGEGARHRYQQLLQAALNALLEDPERLGSKARSDIFPGLISLHLYHCRSAVASHRVIKPRHIVLHRLVTNQALEIVRILHNAMEISRHPPASDQP